MSIEITWFGHSCFYLRTGRHDIVIDPFLDDSPTASVKAADVAADHILLTHAHFDHVADATAIAKRTGATVIVNFEIGEWLKTQGIEAEKILAMNIGGSSELPFGQVKMTSAQHSSSLPDGSYGGEAGGFVLKIRGERIYFAGDTALNLDMKLIGLGGLKLAVLPIGDLFTMGPDDSIEAIKFLSPERVMPCHYGTWPPIAQNAQAWANQVRLQTAAEPIVLKPGEKHSF